MTEQKIRQDLADAYQICAYLGLDDLTYTHLSARVPGADYYFIYPFGLLFEDVTADNLLKVSLQGELLEGKEYQYNQTGYVIHGSIYNKRPDINAIFHLHTVAGVAVSAQENGLLPLSQWALHFYGQISYHAYNSLALTRAEHEDNLLKDLAGNKVMFLKNHGTLTCGTTIQEAMFYTYHLEKACLAQCAIGTSNAIAPSPEICQKAVSDLLGFEKDLGQRDWNAWQNRLAKMRQK